MAAFSLLIVSKSDDFCSVIADLAVSELSCGVQKAASADEARKLAKENAVTISTEALLGQWPSPVIQVKEGDKPLHAASLLFAISSAANKRAQSYTIEELSFSPQQKTLTHLSGKSANLTDKECNLLLALIKAGQEGAEKDILLKEVWGVEEALESHTLETHVYRLRAKLKELGGPNITAMPGVYKLG